MRHAFASMHPLINFIFFASVLTFGMIFMHPACLLISFFGAFSYGLRLNGIRSVHFTLVFLLPLMAVVILINSLFNHAGVTTLFYLRDNPITLESILYGGAAALMLASVLLWFSCYNVVMTSDKFVYLFGRILPAASLIFTMVLRFVPRFKAQIRTISNAQKCVGRDVTNGSLAEKARNGMKILSIMTTWALENAIDTADSMKSRGYGLPGRTSFSLFRFDNRDKGVLIAFMLLIVIVLDGAVSGRFTMQYFPSVRAADIAGPGILFYLFYLLLCLFPIMIDFREERKWTHLK